MMGWIQKDLEVAKDLWVPLKELQSWCVGEGNLPGPEGPPVWRRVQMEAREPPWGSSGARKDSEARRNPTPWSAEPLGGGQGCL